jgi:hypothetical protein
MNSRLARGMAFMPGYSSPGSQNWIDNSSMTLYIYFIGKLFLLSSEKQRKP